MSALNIDWLGDEYMRDGEREVDMVSADQQVMAVIKAKLQQAEVEKKLELIKSFGKDIYNPDTVIIFRKQFTENGVLYSYVALKCPNNRWYVTGPNQYSARGQTWEELTLWMVSGKFPVESFDTLVVAESD